MLPTINRLLILAEEQAKLLRELRAQITGAEPSAVTPPAARPHQNGAAVEPVQKGKRRWQSAPPELIQKAESYTRAGKGPTEVVELTGLSLSSVERIRRRVLSRK